MALASNVCGERARRLWRGAHTLSVCFFADPEIKTSTGHSFSLFASLLLPLFYFSLLPFTWLFLPLICSVDALAVLYTSSHRLPFSPTRSCTTRPIPRRVDQRSSLHQIDLSPIPFPWTQLHSFKYLLLLLFWLHICILPRLIQSYLGTSRHHG